MSGREHYAPGPAAPAEVRKAGERWTLVLVRELRQPPRVVWDALTDPEQLREWAPYDADRNLATPGPVRLTTVGASSAPVPASRVIRAVPPRLLELNWGANAMRWALEPLDGGTRLTLWHEIGRKFVAMGAAGWQICFDVLDRFLAGDPIGRIVGPEATRFGWQRLRAEYARQFGVDAPTDPET